MKKEKNRIWRMMIAGMAILMILLIPMSVKADVVEHVTVKATFMRSVTQEFLRLLNEERTRLGLPEVQLDGSMAEAAEYRAAQVSLYYDHTTPLDGNIWELPIVGNNSGGEILAFIRIGEEPNPNEVAQALWKGWKNSTSHYMIMTDQYYKKFALGTCYVEDALTGYVYSIGLFSKLTEYNPLKDYTQGYQDVTQKIDFDIKSKYLQFAEGREEYLEPGGTMTIQARTINVGLGGNKPGNLDSSCGTWISSNSSVATIDSSGKVTAHSEGEATVVFSLNGSGKTYKATIYVEKVKNGILQDEDGTWWYYENGNRKEGWQVINGKTYYFKGFQHKGMLTGKQYIDGKYYYFHPTEGYLMDEPVSPTPIPGTGATERPVTEPETVTAKVKGKTTSTVSLEWTKARDAEGYTVYKRAQGESAYQRVVIIKGRSNTSYIVKNLKPGIKYYFVIKAWKKNVGTYVFGNSSKTIRGTTRPDTAVIKRITATKSGDLKVQLTGKVAGAAKYAMCYSTRADFKNYTIAMRTQYTTRTMVKGLKPGTYYVKVRAYRILDGKRWYGNWSKAVKVTIK